MAQTVKILPAMQETQIQSLDQEDPLEKGMATHSSILTQRMPRTEEPGGLHSSWGRKQLDMTEWPVLSSLSAELVPSEVSEGGPTVSLPFPASRGHLDSLVCGAFLTSLQLVLPYSHNLPISFLEDLWWWHWAQAG